MRELKRRGHGVNVFTTHPHYPTWRVFDGYGRARRHDVVDGVPVRRLTTYIPHAPNAPKRLAFELSLGARLATTRLPRADVAICTSPALFASGLAMARLRARGIPTVVWAQDLYGVGVAETEMTDKRLAPAVAWAESALLRAADAVITIHPSLRRTLIDQLRLSADRVHVVRNWTHLSPRPPVDRAMVRKRLGWPRDRLVVLHSGAMGFKQGLEVVVDAANTARRRGLPIHFVLMGDGNQRRILEERAGLDPAVHFLDPLPGEEYQDAMGAADILLVVDRPGVGSMAVPSKLTSYFTTGNPVLGSTDAEGNAGVEIRDAGAGLLARPGDAEDLLANILWLAEHPEERASMGRSGLDFYQRELNMDNAVSAVEEILFSIVTRRPSPAHRLTEGVPNP
ncbi:MAG: glycosyltransferase family 4 protein [Tetrasphaera sp.]|nr:glycosyltransferase family 4 protein [Tetrasphaera sp.]